MQTLALHTQTKQERHAFGLALVRAFVVLVADTYAMCADVVNVIQVANKRHGSKPASSVSRFIGWNSGSSIRGANLRVANG